MVIPTSLTAEFLTSFHSTHLIFLSAVLFHARTKHNRLKLEYATTRQADHFSINPLAMISHKTMIVPQLRATVVIISLRRGAMPRRMNIIFRIGGIMKIHTFHTQICIICFDPNSKQANHSNVVSGWRHVIASHMPREGGNMASLHVSNTTFSLENFKVGMR